MNIDFKNLEYFSHFLTNEKGELIEIPLRRGQDNHAFIDYIRFTVDVTTLKSRIPFSEVTTTEQVAEISLIIFDIFGFGIFGDRLGKGKFFYDNFYSLGVDGVIYGEVHIGGNNGKFLVSINGTGCQAAKENWEERLYKFATDLKTIDFSITRCDVAKDFFCGEYTPEQAFLDWQQGFFDVRNVRPKLRREGTDWECNDSSGKTIYIGTRKNSSKYTRIYEKGKQLGDRDSNWTRFEVEFRKSKSRDSKSLIPKDILIHAGEYLAGAYEHLPQDLFIGEQQRIEYKDQAINTHFDVAMKYAKQQVGRFVRLLNDIGYSPEQIRDCLIAPENHYPKNLNPAMYNCKDAIKPIYYHDLAEKYLSTTERFNENLNDLYILAEEWEYKEKQQHKSLNTGLTFEEWQKDERTKSYILMNELIICSKSRREDFLEPLLIKYAEYLNPTNPNPL